MALRHLRVTKRAELACIRVALSPAVFGSASARNYVSQDLQLSTSEIHWRVLNAGSINYWRIVSEIGGGWFASPHEEFQAAGCQQCDER